MRIKDGYCNILNKYSNELFFLHLFINPSGIENVCFVNIKQT